MFLGAQTNSDVSGQQTDRSEIDWDAYASQYDLLAMYNPSYAENIELMRDLLSAKTKSEPKSILDVGAGTGNYLCALGMDFPSARLVHLDSDAAMNGIAGTKYSRAGLENVKLVTAPVIDVEFAEGEFDLIVCVNALYAMPRREETLERIRKWLSPEGYFFVIDFGRPTNIWDWSKYIFGNIIRTRGLSEFFRFLISGRETIRQNRKGSQGQADGTYWLHSTEEFAAALDHAGFRVEHLQTCYREYCDLALCRKTKC
jgi:ubiquinone/menaquinone biosynthesis C-methylase UbiE